MSWLTHDIGRVVGDRYAAMDRVGKLLVEEHAAARDLSLQRRVIATLDYLPKAFVDSTSSDR